MGWVLWWVIAWAQAADVPEPSAPMATTSGTHAVLQDAMRDHMRQRRTAHLTTSATLLGWSLTNIGVGAVGWATAPSREWEHFHQMNLAFNGVNLALAIPGLVRGLRAPVTEVSLRDVVRADATDRVVFGINTGLDVGYIATGAWLWERGLRTDDPLLLGFGRSLVLQGAFLLVFDAIWLVWHGEHAKRFMLTPVVGEVMGVTVQGRF